MRPHPVTGRGAKCSDCHNEKANTLPVTHRNFSKRDCISCHPPLSVIAVPHSVAMGDSRCLLCHGDPAQDLGMPKSPPAARLRGVRVLPCGEPAAADKAPKPAGESKKAKPPITHPVDGAFENCLYCHRIGGEPAMPRAIVRSARIRVCCATGRSLGRCHAPQPEEPGDGRRRRPNSTRARRNGEGCRLSSCSGSTARSRS